MLVLIYLGTSIWVLIDSLNIGIKRGQIKGMFSNGPAGWFFGCLLLWIIYFPAYLVKRNELIKINKK